MSNPVGAQRYGLGGGDAYYDAVKYGGYTGTREQFGRDQAEFAQNATAVAQAREEVERNTQTVLNTAQTFTEETVPAAIQSVEEKGDTEEDRLEARTTELVQSINTAGAVQVQAVEDEGTEQIRLVSGAGTAQVEAVEQAGSDQVDAVEQAGADQVQAVTDEGTTQIGAVTGEGDTQVQRVQDKGDEVIDSIPADYTALDQEVTDLEEALDGIGSSGTEISGGIVSFDSTGKTVEEISISDTTVSSATITRCGKNIFPKFSSGSANGLTWTVASDGTITFSGTPSTDTLLRLQNIYIPWREGTTINITMFNNMTNSRLSLFIVNSDSNAQLNMTSVNATLTKTALATHVAITEFRIRVPIGFDATGLILKPMIVVEDTIDSFEEYKGQSYSVTVTDGVVQDDINLLEGTNTMWSSVGDITVSFAREMGNVADYVAKQLDTVKSQFYRFERSGDASYLYIYYKSGENYVRWQLHNVPAASSNSDTWQIGRICGVTDIDDSNLVEIVRGGEFELAFKENGAADYCGGNNHGDENTDSFVLFIDGKQIDDLTTLDSAVHPFTRIDAFEIATVNRCNTPAEDILKHKKIWTFENGKVGVKQTIKFLETLQVDGMLVCMLAALRSKFPYGIRQGTTDIETMTAAGYEHVTTVSDSVFYLMYGENAVAKIISKTDNPENASALWINDTSDLNKLYYGYYGITASINPTTVPIGTICMVESEYDISYNE